MDKFKKVGNRVQIIVLSFLLIIIALLTYKCIETTNKNNDLNNKIGIMQDDLNVKSTEIARLESVVVEKDDVISNKNLVIKNKDVEIKKINKTLAENKKTLAENKKELKKAKAELKANFSVDTKGSDVGNRKVNVEITAYIAKCVEGCTGITATGINIIGRTTYQGMRIIATDPSVIPLYSIVRVDVDGQSFKAISLDTGGAINGNIVDYLVGSTGEALEFGRKKATVTVLREGK